MAVNKHHTFILRIIILVTFSYQAFGQWPQPIHFHEREGLLCGEIYQLACDNENYIWIASEYGLYRYDGFQFKIFTTNEGLPHNKVIDILVMDGKVVIVTSQGAVAYFNGKRFEPHPLSVVLVEHSQGNRPFPKSLALTEETATLCFSNIGAIEVNAQGVITKTDSSSLPELLGFVASRCKEDTLLLSVSEYIEDQAEQIVSHAMYKKGKISYCQGVSRNFLNYGNLSFSISNGRITHTFLPSKIVSVGFVDSVPYYAYKRGGVSFRLPEKRLDLFPNFTITHAISDMDGGVWIATENNGLYYLKSLWVKNYNTSTDMYYMDVSDIEVTPDNELVVAHRSFSVDLISNSGDFLRTYTTNHREGLSHLMYIHSAQIIAGIADSKLLTIFNPGAQFRVKTHGAVHAHSICHFNDTLFISAPNGIFYLDRKLGDLNSYISYKSTKKSWLLSTGKIFFVVTDNVVNEISQKTLKTIRLPEVPTNTSFTHISQFADTLFIAAKELGLVKVFNNKVIIITEINGFDLKSISSGGQNSHYLFYATMKGIFATPLAHGVPLWNQSFIINQSSGISSLETEKIVVTEQNLYVKNKRGVDVIPMGEIHNIPEVTLANPSVFINGLETSFKETLYLQEGDHNVQFYFPLRLYSQEKFFRIRYFVRGYHNHVVETDQPMISVMNLPYGEFKTTFQVSDNKGGWSKPLEIKIIKTEPLYKKTWFIILIILSAFSLVSYAIFLRIVLMYKKSELLSEKKQHSHHIIAQQLNPHFTFNSLNAIHHFVLVNNRDESSRYLVKFSKLMRSVIDYSEQEYISIENEVNTLLLYVELEQLRFPGKFTFTTHIDSNINRNELLVTPFLIQPLVENAIRHGVTQRETPGDIELEIKTDSEFLIVTVQDNGIGRAEAEKRKQASQGKAKTVGLSIVHQRIKNYNAINREKISFNIVDLFHDNGTPSGTKVILLLPLIRKSVYLGTSN
jgi:hypothetical protein